MQHQKLFLGSWTGIAIKMSRPAAHREDMGAHMQ